MKPYWCVCMAYTTHTHSLTERINQPLIFFSPTKNKPVDPIAASAHDHISPLPHNSGNVVTYQVGSRDRCDSNCARLHPERCCPLCVEALGSRWTRLETQWTLPRSWVFWYAYAAVRAEEWDVFLELTFVCGRAWEPFSSSTLYRGLNVWLFVITMLTIFGHGAVPPFLNGSCSL